MDIDATPQPPRTPDTIQSSLFFNLIGQVAAVASGALISVLLARHFGAELLGQWSVALVYGNLVGTFVEGGLGKVLMRDAARTPELAGRALGTVIKGRLLLGAITIPVALAASALLNPSLATWLLVLVLVLSRWIEGIQASFQAALYTVGDFRTPNLLEMIRRFARVACVALVVVLNASIHWAAVAMLATAILSSGRLAAATRRHFPIDFRGNVSDSWADAAWFWANGVLFWINSEVSVLLLSELANDRVTGIYAAATRLTALFLIVPRTLNNSLIPRLFRSAKTGIGLHRQLAGSSLFLAALGTLIAVESWFVGQPLIELVYGSAYRESGPVFTLLATFVFLNFVRVPASWYLSTSDRVRLVTIAMGAASVLNVIAGLLLIPRMGAVGAAWAAVASELVLAVFVVGATTAFVGPRVVIALGAGIGFGAVAGALHLVLANRLPWFLVAAIVSGAALAGLYAVARKLLRGWNPGGLLGKA